MFTGLADIPLWPVFLLNDGMRSAFWQGAFFDGRNLGKVEIYKEKEKQKELKDLEQKEKREDLRAELVDKYLVYKERGSITDMELDNFLKKEERYESYKGNSYVHDTIKPFILTLRVVNEINKTE